MTWRNLRPGAAAPVLLSVLLFLPASASRAAVVSSSWIGEIGTWNSSQNWSPAEVPNNLIDTYRVDISDASSDVSLDLDVAIDNLSLGNGAVLSITGKSLEIEGDTRSGPANTITNNGQIELKGSGAGSQLVIDGVVDYLGGGKILFDDNVLHRMVGGGGSAQILRVGDVDMNLEGATGGGARRESRRTQERCGGLGGWGADGAARLGAGLPVTS